MLKDLAEEEVRCVDLKGGRVGLLPRKQLFEIGASL